MPDMDGRTAFMWAAGKGANKVLKMFIKHGVDMHNADKNGGTGRSFKMLQIYLELVLEVIILSYITEDE